jgi:hypothetical protein
LVKALLSIEPGKTLLVYRELLSGSELRQIWRRVMGKSWMESRTCIDDLLKTVSEMNERAITEEMAYLSEFGYAGGDDPTLIHPRDVGFV